MILLLGGFRGYRQFSAADCPLDLMDAVGVPSALIQVWDAGTLTVKCGDPLAANRPASNEEALTAAAAGFLPVATCEIKSWTGALPFIVYW